MRKLILGMLFCVLGIGSAWAQKTFSGKVTEAGGLGLPGVNVVLKSDQTVGASTDIDGNWSLVVPNENSILVFRSVGMKTVEMAAKNAKSFEMKPDAEILDDVVVVAYGTVKKESLVGAQASVSSDKLAERPITNVTNALSGVAPGVQVTTSSGQPGASSEIMIRGFGSVNASSKPLYVVDGSVYNGDISDISSSDVASISILKDAASTSLYGSSAGNGVVLITTKSGQKSKEGKPHFNFTMHQGVSRKGQEDYEKIGAMEHFTTRWQQWYNQYKYTKGMQDELAGTLASIDVYNDLKANPYKGIKTYIEELPTGGYGLTKTPTAGRANFPLIVMPDGKLNPEITGLLYGDDLDWADGLYRTGVRSEYNLSGAYKTEKMKSFFSFGHVDEEGYRIKTGMKRYTGRANLSYDANKHITIGTNLSFGATTVTEPKSKNGFSFLRGIAPVYPIHQHNADGSYVLNEYRNKLYDHNFTRPYTPRFNPIEEAYLDLSTYKKDVVSSRSFVNVNILPELKFKMNVAYDLYQSLEKVRYNNKMGDQPAGLLILSNLRRSTLTLNELLEYNKDFDDHHLNVLLGHESYEFESHEDNSIKKGMGILGIDEMANLLDVVDIASVTNNYRKEGYFGRINYDYDYRYNISASYRRDGTSRLHPDHRWGNFWSVGAGWHLKKEEFLEDVDWLDALKLRLSVGQTGNDAFSSYYAYQTTYGLGKNNINRSGLRLNTFADEKLKWETQTSYDLALEFGVFRFMRGTIELFNKESKDLIFGVPLPASTGIGSMDKNIGKVRNYGLEFALSFDLIRNDDINWTFNVNGTSLKNEIVSLPEDNRKDGIEKGEHKHMEGNSIYEFYLREWIGVDPADGLAIYRLDKDAYPDAKGLENTGEKSTWTKDGRLAKKHFCGTSIPKLYGGFGTNFSWKNFDFGTQFSYQLGGKIYDGIYQGLMGRNLSGGRAMHVDMKSAWKKPGDKTDVPRLDAGTAGDYDALGSDRFLISSDALMLKSITLGYNLPERLSKKLELSNVRFSVAAENLFMLSKRRGLNPMMNYKGVTGDEFYDYAKTIVGTISFSF